MTAKEQDLFIYECVPNIDGYDPKLLLGLTFAELAASGMGLIIPALLLQTAGGVVVGLLTAITLLLLLKRFERLGNLPLPLFLVRRFSADHRQAVLLLPQLVPSINATIDVHTFEGEHIATVN